MIFSHDRHPGDLALDDGARRRSWAELSDRATRAARLLREGLGLRPDDHAALLMGNRAEFVELTLGAILAGRPELELHFEYKKDGEIVAFLDSGQPAARGPE